LIVAVGGVLCIALGIAAIIAAPATSPASPGPDAAGSCWSIEDDDQLGPVLCDATHDYRVTSIVADPNSCPSSSTYYVELTGARIGCLVDD